MGGQRVLMGSLWQQTDFRNGYFGVSEDKSFTWFLLANLNTNHIDSARIRDPSTRHGRQVWTDNEAGVWGGGGGGVGGGGSIVYEQCVPPSIVPC